MCTVKPGEERRSPHSCLPIKKLLKLCVDNSLANIERFCFVSFSTTRECIRHFEGTVFVKESRLDTVLDIATHIYHYPNNHDRKSDFYGGAF